MNNLSTANLNEQKNAKKIELRILYKTKLLMR